MSWRLYVTDTGNKVVRGELDEFGVDARARMTELMQRANRGETLPREREHIEGDIHCLRLSMAHKEYRLLYSREAAGGHVLLALTAHAKKERKLPRRVIERAQRRLKDHRSRAKPRAVVN